MENAVIALSKLPRPPYVKGATRRPDLAEINMQGARLTNIELKDANLIRAKLQGANLSWADLQGAILLRARLQGANLLRAQLQGADLLRAQFDADTSFTAATLRGAAVKEVDFTNVPQIGPHLDTLFGDSTTQLPKGIDRPDHFNVENKNWNDFETAWRKFQRAIGQDPDHPT
ncbi:MAG: pentapeptide repeat-containing protein [Sulfitobacter sp.]